MASLPVHRHRLAAALLISLASLSLGVVPCRGQTSEGAAVKQLKKAMKSLTAQYATKVDLARSFYFATLDGIEDNIKAGGFSSVEAQDIFDASETFVSDLGTASLDFGLDVPSTVQPVLAAFAGGAALQDFFPVAFYTGSGGPVDAARLALQVKIEKALASARKRVAKLAKVAEKSGSSLTVLLRASPPYLSAGTYEESLDSFSFESNPVTLDVLVATSSLDALGDGEIRAGGQGSSHDSAFLLCEASSPSGSDDMITTVAAETNRWSAHLDGGGSGLHEGMYLMRATQSTYSIGTVGDIGIR